MRMHICCRAAAGCESQIQHNKVADNAFLSSPVPLLMLVFAAEDLHGCRSPAPRSAAGGNSKPQKQVLSRRRLVYGLRAAF